MAHKPLTIPLDHTFTSGRGETETVAAALAWLVANMPESDYTPGDLIVYAVRRLRALHSDGKRHASGALAERLYKPRLDNVEKAPRGVVEAVKALGEVQAAMAKVAEKGKAVKKAAK